MKCANGTQFTRVYDKLERHSGDMDDCSLCANFESRKVGGGNGSCGCGRSVCGFQDIKDETIRNRRIKRERGWRKNV